MESPWPVQNNLARLVMTDRDIWKSSFAATPECLTLAQLEFWRREDHTSASCGLSALSGELADAEVYLNRQSASGRRRSGRLDQLALDRRLIQHQESVALSRPCSYAESRNAGFMVGENLGIKVLALGIPGNRACDSSRGGSSSFAAPKGTGLEAMPVASP